ncbi:MAG: hypothetical protein ACAI35_23335 [Candidatus Methylacidiphilales bacterium]|nr:hypothetical protein [Candidatus Methylacidiphilales bacterium]
MSLTFWIVIIVSLIIRAYRASSDDTNTQPAISAQDMIVLQHLERWQKSLDIRDYATAEAELNAAEAAHKGTAVPAMLFVRRGIVRFLRQNYTGADADMNRSEKRDKYTSGTGGGMEAGDYVMRAEVRLFVGRLKEAIAELEKCKIIPQGDLHQGKIARLLGIAHYCQGDMPAAARNWAHGAGNVSDSTFLMRWCALTRMGAEAGATRELEGLDNATFHEKDADAVWYDYIRKYLIGRLSAEQLLQHATSLSTDEKAQGMRKCQASFYIAAALQGKDKEEALFELNNCLWRKETSAYESLMAQADLNRLKPAEPPSSAPPTALGGAGRVIRPSPPAPSSSA